MLFTLVWGSQWEIIIRNNKCTTVLSGGTQMLDIDYNYLLAIHKLNKRFSQFWNANYCAPWKELEEQLSVPEYVIKYRRL